MAREDCATFNILGSEVMPWTSPTHGGHKSERHIFRIVRASGAAQQSRVSPSATIGKLLWDTQMLSTMVPLVKGMSMLDASMLNRERDTSRQLRLHVERAVPPPSLPDGTQGSATRGAASVQSSGTPSSRRLCEHNLVLARLGLSPD